MAEHVNLGKLLRQKRLAKGLTQLELGEKLEGIHSQFVSSWELGECTPPTRCLPGLVEILDVTQEALVQAMVKDAKIAIEKKIYPKKAAKKKA